MTKNLCYVWAWSVENHCLTSDTLYTKKKVRNTCVDKEQCVDVNTTHNIWDDMDYLTPNEH